MYTDMGSPPIIEYEKVVRPVAVTTRDAALSKRDRRDDLLKKRGIKKRRKKNEEEKDILFEPYLGKLFDYSA